MRKIVVLLLSLSILVVVFVQAKGQAQGTQDIAVGKRLYGFEVTKSLTLPEANCRVVELEHTKSGAHVLHIQNDDPENFFAICFRTHPITSNGVAHILEHSVFQGSEKFPVNGVFMHMTKRSFATFMNAMTGSDFTFYPAASQSPEDFYNLLKVYLDAAFHPLLTKSSFLQEGHRLEFASYDDPATPLMYKGVVYNEMKGKLAAPQARFNRAMISELLPVSTKRAFSGGDPEEIPDLTYEEFVDFHKKHYYPGNCLFFFYGNLPLESHLQFLIEHELKESTKKSPIAPLPEEPPFASVAVSEHNYPASAEDSPIVGISWLTASLKESDEVMAMRVLDYILMAHDASPLKHELLSSGLCKEVDSILDISRAQMPYTLYIAGCSSENSALLEMLVAKTLQRIVQEGIPNESIESALARIELENSELKKGLEPVGLSLFFRCAVAKLHGGQAEDGLTLHSQIDRLKKKLCDDPDYLQRILKKYLIDNSHKVCALFKPSSDLAKEEQEREKQKLMALEAGLTDAQRAEIVANAVTMREGSSEMRQLLPTITLESVSREITQFPVTMHSFDNFKLFHHQTFTNSVTYASLEFALPELAVDELWAVGLYTYLLPQLGSSGRGYKDHLSFIDKHTGGIVADIVIHEREMRPYAALRISGKALDRKGILLLDLLADCMREADFTDKERIRQLLIKHAVELPVAIHNNPLALATLATMSSQNIAACLGSSWEGIEYVSSVMYLVEHLDEELDPLLAKLQRLQKRLQQQQKPHLLVACDAAAFNSYSAAQFGKISTFKPVENSPWHVAFSLPVARSFAYPIQSSVAFNARGFQTIRYRDPDSAKLWLAAELMTAKYLHPIIREQGGAYGAGASFDPSSGNFIFFSYRDPNIASSNEAFAQAIDLVCDGAFDADDVQRAKIALFQRIDAPLHPSMRLSFGYQLLVTGRSDEERRLFRQSLLDATKTDIQRAAANHLAGAFPKSVLVSFASKELIEHENAKLAQPLSIYSR